MSSAPREAMVPLTRWQYFTKTLYHNAAAKTLFVYNKVIYEKDEALQQIEEVNSRINMVLLLVLLVMFFTASTMRNIYIIVAGMAVIVAGEIVRLLRLPRDIKAHLTDTGRRERRPWRTSHPSPALKRPLRRNLASHGRAAWPTAPAASSLNRPTASRRPCGGWRIFPTSG